MELTELKIPQHIAIIMDGNGRWAKKRHRPRTFGHTKGADVLEQILMDCDELGVKYLTVYAFSTENWARPYEEVKVIMDLFRKYLISSVEKCARNNVRARIIGDKSKLSPDIVEAINNLEEKTKDNTGITFQIAMNYGSRDEILRAVKLLVKDEVAKAFALSGQKCAGGDSGKTQVSGIDRDQLDPSLAEDAGKTQVAGVSTSSAFTRERLDALVDQIDEKTIEKYLDTADCPDPDLLIRTSGEERLSNFLMWQLAYTEFYFTDVLWPDFNKAELIKAIEKYSSRDRRYGGIKK